MLSAEKIEALWATRNDPRNEEDVPYIFCKRFFKRKPQGSRSLQLEGGHLLTDYRFEGLRKVMRSGKMEFEVDKNYCMSIMPDGRCPIPDTEFNRKLLSDLQLKKNRVSRTSTEVVLEDGEIKNKKIETYDPPEYEIVEQVSVKDRFPKEVVDNLKQELMADLKKEMQKESKKKAKDAELLNT